MRRLHSLVFFALFAVCGCGSSDQRAAAPSATTPAATSSAATSPATTPASTTPKRGASAQCFDQGIHIPKGGEGACLIKQRKVWIADMGTTARLNRLSVRLDRIEQASSVNATIATARPDGVFVVAHLSVTNNTHAPLSLTPDMFALWAGRDLNAPSENKDLYALDDLLNQSTFGTIGPDITRTGRVIFDISPRNAQRLKTTGAIWVGQPASSGDEVDQSARVAILRTHA